MALNQTTAEVERVEAIKAVTDDDENEQSPANTAEQQAIQTAVESAKTEIVDAVNAQVSAPPIEDRGTPISIQLSQAETTTVPDQSTWRVTISAVGGDMSNDDEAFVSLDGSTLIALHSDNGDNIKQTHSTEIWLHSGQEVKAANLGDFQVVHINGWEL
jgi:hypothetical protein